MSKQALETFQQQLRNNEALREALTAAKNASDEIDIEDFLRIAGDNGFDITSDDLQGGLAAGSELSEAQLDDIAGGPTEELFGNYNFFAEPVTKLKIRL